MMAACPLVTYIAVGAPSNDGAPAALLAPEVKEPQPSSTEAYWATGARELGTSTVDDAPKSALPTDTRPVSSQVDLDAHRRQYVDRHEFNDGQVVAGLGRSFLTSDPPKREGELSSYRYKNALPSPGGGSEARHKPSGRGPLLRKHVTFADAARRLPAR